MKHRYITPSATIVDMGSDNSILAGSIPSSIDPPTIDLGSPAKGDSFIDDFDLGEGLDFTGNDNSVLFDE